jgi:two-component system cell cycle response regulator
MNVKLESDDRLVSTLLLCLQCLSSRLARLLFTGNSSIGEDARIGWTVRAGAKEKIIPANGRPAGHAHLVVLQGPGLGDFYFLDGGELVLGNDPFRADIVVRDVEVEPRHASIHREPDSGVYVVRDLGTGEGTAVNGELFGGSGRRRLRDGDRIFVGDSVLEFSQGDPVKAQFHTALDRLINRDYLTGLLTKKRFDEEFEHCLEATAAANKPMSVLMADIDNLKKINDRHGHLLGEFVVGAVGRIIGQSHEEGGRRATRFGGDEYQTILPGLAKEKALQVAEEVRRQIEEYAFEHEGTLADPTLCIGVASYPEDGVTRNELTHAADEALYRAKRAGGNTVSL